MIYPIEELRAYTRNLDVRLEDTSVYSDTWLDYRIEEGIAAVQDIKPIFSTTERYDLTRNIIINKLLEVELALQKEPHSVIKIEGDFEFFSIVATPNNHILIKRIPDAPLTTDMIVTVTYYYYPTIPFTTLEMSMEMYKVVKAGLAMVVFDWLSDQVSEKLYRDKIESYLLKGTFDLEKDIMSNDVTLLWRRSWV